MAKQVCAGALLACPFGNAKSPLNVLPDKRVFTESKPAATILDNKPFVNIMPFGMCSSPSNPAVIAAMGSPVPCTPVIPAPWVPGNPKVLIGNIPVVTDQCKLTCAYASVISVDKPGQNSVNE